MEFEVGASEKSQGIPYLDIVQFSSAVYFALEHEKSIEIDVVRFGSAATEAWVEYSTEDSSSEAGRNYLPRFGKLHFPPGTCTCTIYIPILDTNHPYDICTEFVVRLVNPVGCDLGVYLYAARIKIIDTVTFPQGVDRELLRPHELKNIPDLQLMRAFVKTNLREPKVKKAASRIFVTNLAADCYFIWVTILFKELLDAVLMPNIVCSVQCRLETRESMFMPAGWKANNKVFLLFLLVIVPSPLVHFLKVMQFYRQFSVTAPCRTMLQTSLMRRYLHYDEASRLAVAQRITHGITRDADVAIKDGFLQVFPLCSAMARIFLGVAASFVLAPLGGALLLASTLCGLGALYSSQRRASQLRLKKEEQHRALVGHVDEVVDNYRVICDYDRRPVMIDFHKKRLDKFNSCASALVRFGARVEFALRTVIVVFAALWVWLGCQAVIDEHLRVGRFVAVLVFFFSTETSLRDILGSLNTMGTASSSLRNVTQFMNMPTNLKRRMTASRHRRRVGEDQRAQARQQMLEDLFAIQPSISEDTVTCNPGTMSNYGDQELPTGVPKKTSTRSLSQHHGDSTPIDNMVFAVDKIKIQVSGATFSYAKDQYRHCEVLRNVAFELEQGQLVAVYGPHRGGKATLAQLLAQVLFPDAGEFFVPPHLRVLYLDWLPSILEGTLMENLTFGCVHHGEDHRVLPVAKALGLPRDLLQELDTEEDLETRYMDHNSQSITYDRHRKLPDMVRSLKSLNFSDKVLVHLARAFVANPEVLVLHKPFEHFNPGQRKIVQAAFRQFVDNRGIAMDPETYSRRRPRTMIFTTSNEQDLGIADVVLEVSDGQLHRRVDHVKPGTRGALDPAGLSRLPIGVRHSAPSLTR